MKTLRLGGIISALFLSICVLQLTGCADLGAPAVAVKSEPSPEASPPVKITEDANFWTLDNGIVKARVSKRSGNMPSLVYHGTETMSAGGAWEETPQGAPKITQTITIDPSKNGGQRAEVSVAGKTGGAVMLTPGAPGGGTYCDIEIRTALGRGDSGVYTYAIFSHPAAYGNMGVGESRFITFISKAFDWISVDADRNMLECAPTD